MLYCRGYQIIAARYDLQLIGICPIDALRAYALKLRLVDLLCQGFYLVVIVLAPDSLRRPRIDEVCPISGIIFT